jgi:hypothetical protein
MEYIHAYRKTDKKWQFWAVRKLCYKNAMVLVLFLTADLKYHQFYEAENQPFSRYYWAFERYTKLYC